MCWLLIWSEAVRGCVQERAYCWYGVKVAEGVSVNAVLFADMKWNCQRVCWRMCLFLMYSEGGRGCVGESYASCWHRAKLSKGVLMNVLVADMEWNWQRVCWCMLWQLVCSEVVKGCVEECARCWCGVNLAKGVLVNVELVDMKWSCQRVCWRLRLLLIWSEESRGCVGECSASCWYGMKLSKGVLKNVLVADVEWIWQRVCWWMLS